MSLLGPKTTLHEGHHLRLLSQQRTCNDKQCVRELVERKNSSDVAIILAITIDDYIIIERSFRVPMQTYVRELPAGLVDVPGEDPKETVKRELLEETGYAGDDITFIATCPTDQGIINSRGQCYIVRNAKKIADQNLGHDELLEVHLIPRASVRSFLAEKTQTGDLIDMKIYALLSFVD